MIDFDLSAVVELMVVDDTLRIPEGGMAFICVSVTGSLQQRETDIILTHSVIVGNSFTSMLLSTYSCHDDIISCLFSYFRGKCRLSNR
jgi:hypothetical protein